MGQLPVIIIGGGIAGLSLGLELTKRGADVTLLEQNEIASGASGAAAAYLEPRTGTGGLRAIEWASLEEWPAYAAAIEKAAGIDLDYRTDGQVHVAFEDALARLRQDFEKRTSVGTPATWLTADAVRALEPELAPDIAAGFSLDQVHWLDGCKLCAALATLLRQAGANVREHAGVVSVARKDGNLCISTADETWTADKLAICCAMGRNHIAGLPQDVPLCRPVRGVMLSVAMAPARPLLRRVIKHAKGILCPRSDGRLLVGPTSEKGETSPVVSESVQHQLLETATRFVPALADLEVSEVSSGIRALVGDGALKLGQSSEMPGVYYSLSHGGSGYLRTPVIARELASYVDDENAPCPLTSPYLTRLG
ncbi:MAG: FAD-dependent oxidoreductase [Alphaproteobacteria bacterium]|nr:FAD-dependent oxidoreductase [Alphaproteobacteria bacterium]